MLVRSDDDVSNGIVGGVKSRRGANGLSIVRLVHIDVEGKEREAAIEAEALSKGKDSALLTTVRAAKVDIAGEEKKKAGALTLCKGTNKGDIVSDMTGTLVDDTKNLSSSELPSLSATSILGEGNPSEIEENNMTDGAHASRQKNIAIIDSLPVPRSRQSLTSETDKPPGSLSNPTSSSVSPVKPILRRSFNILQRNNQPLTELEIAVRNFDNDSKDGNLDYKDCYRGE